MRKTYTQPELGTKRYAQFESVFTGCSRNPSKTDCLYNASVDENGRNNITGVQEYSPNGWDHHTKLKGSVS